MLASHACVLGYHPFSKPKIVTQLIFHSLYVSANLKIRENDPLSRDKKSGKSPYPVLPSPEQDGEISIFKVRKKNFVTPIT